MNSIEGFQGVPKSSFSRRFSRSNPRPTLANFNSSINASCQCFVSGAISSIDLILGITIYGSVVSAHAILDDAIFLSNLWLPSVCSPLIPASRSSLAFLPLSKQEVSSSRTILHPLIRMYRTIRIRTRGSIFAPTIHGVETSNSSRAFFLIALILQRRPGRLALPQLHPVDPMLQVSHPGQSWRQIFSSAQLLRSTAGCKKRWAINHSQLGCRTHVSKLAGLFDSLAALAHSATVYL